MPDSVSQLLIVYCVECTSITPLHPIAVAAPCFPSSPPSLPPPPPASLPISACITLTLPPFHPSMATHPKESVGRLNPHTHSDSCPSASPAMVTVAVLPPQLPPPGIPAPPTGVGMADAFSWDEALNWSSHRGAEPAPEAPSTATATATTRKASFLRRTFSSERAKRH